VEVQGLAGAAAKVRPRALCRDPKGGTEIKTS
jgi:hypothetical protein